ncbi:MAG: T9SS C-terminal target domain-containing protein, partial [Bacteroidetes bacterium]
LTAHFSLNTYTITVNAAPSAGGTVSGGGSYDHGQTATLSATPASGYTFVNWTENGNVVSTQQSFLFNVTGNRNLTANFSMEAYTVALTANPANAGTLTGGGNYNHGQTATLTATPSAGYTFVNWTENGDAVSNYPGYSFTVTGNRNLTAHFSLNTYTITVNAEPSEGGAVSGGGSYDHGQTATLSAIPASGHTFLYWTKNGNIIAEETEYVFAVTESSTITAHFETSNYTISLEASPAAGGSVIGSGIYNPGETVAVTAIANPDFVFIFWTENGEVVSFDEQYSFIANGNRHLSAVFESTLALYTIKAKSNPAGFAIITGAGYYTENDWVVLNINPIDESAVFVGWEINGNIVSRDEQYRFIASNDMHVIAQFTHNQRIFSVEAASIFNDVLIKGTGNYPEKENVILEVFQPDNLKFIGWRNAAGQIVSRSNPYSFDVNRDVWLEVLLELKTEEEMFREETVTIYPNPTDGRFYVNVENPYELEIRDTSGLLVWRQSLEPGDNFVDIAYLPLGMYLLNLYDTEKTISRKIILK